MAAGAGRVYAGVEPLRAEDVAELAWVVTTLPGQVNVNALEVMSVGQTWGPLAVHRRS